jgi:hypothetical protein
MLANFDWLKTRLEALRTAFAHRLNAKRSTATSPIVEAGDTRELETAN